MKMLNQAYQAYRVLSDPELRKAHYSWIINQIKKNAIDDKLGIWGDLNQTNSNGQFITDSRGRCQSEKTKSKNVAGFLALLLGGLGVHRFYLGQWIGIFYLLFVWTLFPVIIAFFEGLWFLFMKKEKWEGKYDYGKNISVGDGVAILSVGSFIGISGAIAIPAHQDFTIRAKVSEAIGMSINVRKAVSEYALREQQWPENNSMIGISEDLSSNYVSSLSVDKGVIYVEMTPETGTKGALVLIPSYLDGVITWTCNESTVESKYLPVKCR